MIKRLCVSAMILLFVMNLAAPAFCGDNALTKLGRGLCNVLTFPLEIPEQMSRMNNTDGPFAGSTVGVLKGLWCALGRACVGIFETTTFMMPFPKDYGPILKDPEYFSENSNY